MLECTEARHRVKRAEAFPFDLTCVLEVALDPFLAASRHLRRGQRHPHSVPAASPGVGQQRAPAATEVEQASSRPDPDLFGHVVGLATLRLLEGEREAAVELRAAEIGQLTEAEPD